MEDEEYIAKSLAKTKKNLNCEILNVSRKKINYQINFLNYEKLRKLDCSQNQIESLDSVLPGTILDLNCSNNKLTKLDDLPPQLRILVCHHNILKTLDNLPGGIFKLDCAFNELVHLDNLPNCLEYLFCNNNYIQSLNCLPICLKYLYCQNNDRKIQLINLPHLEKIITD